MTRTNSTKIDQITDGIEILQEAHESWPAGATHPLISEVLKKAEADFKEQLYQEERRRKTPGEGTRRSKKE